MTKIKTVSANKVNQAMDQKRNGKGGRFAELNPCYGCGKSAGSNYFSHPLTDSLSPSGEGWGDAALVLCGKCADATNDIVEVGEFQAWAAKNFPTVHAKNYHSDGSVCQHVLKPVKVTSSSFDEKHVAGTWEVSGPATSYPSFADCEAKTNGTYKGYGVNAVEPKSFGGTRVFEHGLTKAEAEKIVADHNKGAK